MQFAVAVFYPTTSGAVYQNNKAEIISALHNIKGSIGGRSLFLVLFHRKSHDLFHARFSRYYHTRLDEKFTAWEITRENIEKVIQDLEEAIL